MDTLVVAIQISKIADFKVEGFILVPSVGLKLVQQGEVLCIRVIWAHQGIFKTLWKHSSRAVMLEYLDESLVDVHPTFSRAGNGNKGQRIFWRMPLLGPSPG